MDIAARVLPPGSGRQHCVAPQRASSDLHGRTRLTRKRDYGVRELLLALPAKCAFSSLVGDGREDLSWRNSGDLVKSSLNPLTATIIFCCAFLACLLFVVRPARSQTPPVAASNETSTNLPKIVDSCTEQGPGPQGRVCVSWFRDGDLYREANSQTGTLSVQRFDRSSAVFVRKEAGQTVTYSGRLTGNRIEGTAAYSLDRASTTKMPSFKWAARFFYPPKGDPALGRHVYVACNDQFP